MSNRAMCAVDTGDGSFEAGFKASGGAKVGACVDTWIHTYCVSFGLDVSASGTIKCQRGQLSVHGSFKVGADLPVLGHESVKLSF